MLRAHRSLLLTLLPLIGLLAACAPSEDPAVLKHRERLKLTAEPTGAIAFVDANKKLKEDEGEGEMAVTLTGRVSIDEESWDSKRARFVITDALNEDPTHAATPGHDPSTCPFCKNRKEKNGRAIVQLNDENGKVLPLDARRIFQLADNQLVVVKGSATINDLGVLQVQADGVFFK